MNVTNWRPNRLALNFHLDAEPRRAIWMSTLIVLSFFMLALLVQRFEAPPVLAVILLCLGAASLLLWPEAATIVTVFLLYINFPAVLTKQHGVPDLAAGSFILLLAVPLMHLLFVRGERFRTDTTLWLMVGFLLVLMLSSLGAVEKGAAIQRVLAFVFEGLVLYWLITNVIRSERVLRRCIWTLVAAGALLSGLSLYQDVTGSYRQEFGGLAYRNYVVTVGEEERTGRSTWDRAQGPVDEPNRFAQILIVLVPLAVLCYRSGRSRSVRLCAAGAGLLILAGIGITLSRGAFVGLVLMGFAMVKARWVRPAHMMACLAACVVAMSIMSPDYIPRILSIVNVKHLVADNESDREQADGAIRGRMTSMLTAAHVFRSNSVLGVGPGQFRFHYMDTYKANPETAFRDDVRGPRRAHNLYLEIGAESGIIGLALFLAITLGLMRALWRMRSRWLKQSTRLADLTTAFWLSLLAYMVTGVFLHLSYQRYYWFLVAMAGATLHVLYTRRSVAIGEMAGTPAAGVISRPGLRRGT